MSENDTEARLKAEFDEWFARLQAIETRRSGAKLDPEDWAGRWFDGYTPEEALEDGPEDAP